MPRVSFPVTGDDVADRLLVEDPLALLIGMLLDQQVPMEWAFRGPATLQGRLGGLDAGAIAAMTPEALDEVFRAKPAVHRFPSAMAKRTHALCVHLVEHYDGDTARIAPKPVQQLGDRKRFAKCADFTVYPDFQHDESRSSSAMSLVAGYAKSLYSEERMVGSSHVSCLPTNH